MRPLSEPVPRLDHRQAAVTEAPDHGSTGSPVRQDTDLPRHVRPHVQRPRDTPDGTVRPGRGPLTQRTSRRTGVRFPPGPRAGTGTDRPAARRDPRREWRDRPRGSCGRARPAAPASNSARSTSSTSTTSSTCAGTRSFVESAFPGELGGLFTNLETSGNPWGAGARTRLDWARASTSRSPSWAPASRTSPRSTTCSGSAVPEPPTTGRNATTRAVAELLHLRGRHVRRPRREGDLHRRRRAARRQRVPLPAAGRSGTSRPSTGPRPPGSSSPARTASTRLKNEYPQVGGHYDVVHHTQLLNRLVREGRLTPRRPPSGAERDRHLPRPVLPRPAQRRVRTAPGADRRPAGAGLTEMPRSSAGSFCCGAGGARLWMEEDLGQRVNDDRAAEAVATGAEQVGVACPFCLVMLGDGVAGRRGPGPGRARSRSWTSRRCCSAPSVTARTTRDPRRRPQRPPDGGLPPGPGHTRRGGGGPGFGRAGSGAAGPGPAGRPGDTGDGDTGDGGSGDGGSGDGGSGDGGSGGGGVSPVPVPARRAGRGRRPGGLARRCNRLARAPRSSIELAAAALAAWTSA